MFKVKDLVLNFGTSRYMYDWRRYWQRAYLSIGTAVTYIVY